MPAARILPLALALALGALYLWALWLALSPQVSDEYRAYFIDRTTNDWRPARYAASPAEGFGFARRGLPSFVASTQGISAREDWGRWTDANLGPRAVIRLAAPLSGRICLSLLANAATPQAGKPVILRAGSGTLRFVPPDTATRWYRFPLDLRAPTRSIEIEPTVARAPSRWLKGSADRRRVALGLRRLILTEGACPKDD